MLTRRASARSRPAHRCLSTLLDTGLSVTGSPLRRGERVRKGVTLSETAIDERTPHLSPPHSFIQFCPLAWLIP